jgi:hypothetical protein
MDDSQSTSEALTPTTPNVSDMLTDCEDAPEEFAKKSRLSKYSTYRSFTIDMMHAVEKLEPDHILNLLDLGQDMILIPTGEQFGKVLSLFTECLIAVRDNYMDYMHPQTEPMTLLPEVTPNAWLEKYMKAFASKKLFEVPSYLKMKEILIEYLRSLNAINSIEKDQAYESSQWKKKDETQLIENRSGMSISCTTATGTTDHAVVPFFDNRHPFVMLKERFGGNTLPSTTSYGNSYISAKGMFLENRRMPIPDRASLLAIAGFEGCSISRSLPTHARIDESVHHRGTHQCIRPCPIS